MGERCIAESFDKGVDQFLVDVEVILCVVFISIINKYIHSSIILFESFKHITKMIN